MMNLIQFMCLMFRCHGTKNLRLANNGFKKKEVTIFPSQIIPFYNTYF